MLLVVCCSLWNDIDMTEIRFLNFDFITNELLQESRKYGHNSVFSLKKETTSPKIASGHTEWPLN